MVFPQAANSSSVMTNKMILQNFCDLKIRARSATKPIGKMCEWKLLSCNLFSFQNILTTVVFCKEWERFSITLFLAPGDGLEP